jgi:hypothetical protein
VDAVDAVHAGWARLEETVRVVDRDGPEGVDRHVVADAQFVATNWKPGVDDEVGRFPGRQPAPPGGRTQQMPVSDDANA